MATVFKKLQQTSLPGFDGISIYDVGNFFLAEIKRDRITVRSRAMAFSFIQATFPALLFIVTLIPYVPIEGLSENFIRLLHDVLPLSDYSALDRMVNDIFNRQRFELLSFGFFFAFYFATNGATSMVTAFDKRQPTFRRRAFWHDKLVAIQLTLYIVILFIGSLSLIIWGQDIVKATGVKFSIDGKNVVILLTALRWLIVFFLYFGSISMIYHYGPAKKQKWKFVTPGSTLATFLSIAATFCFALFVSRFGSYNQIYGSLSAFIIFMIWMNINTLVLLVGFELNNSIDMNKQLRQPTAE